MQCFVVCLLAISFPLFEADCPVSMMSEITIVGQDPICMLSFADCTNGATAPVMVFGNCEADLCGCVDSSCDCETPNPTPDEPLDPTDPTDPTDPADPTDPGTDPTPDPTDPDAEPRPEPAGLGGVVAPEAVAVEEEDEIEPPVLGQPLQFDGRILRPNQSLEGKTIRIANAANEDPSTDLFKVPKEVTVDRVTSVRFGPGVKFTEEAFYGLFELKTVAPVKYTVNGMEFSIPTDKKFHIAIRLKNEPKELSNLGRSYRALVRNDSEESPQEGVITLDGVQYHAIGRK